MKTLIVAACLLFGSAAQAQSAPRCAADALQQARKLLVFHFGPDDRIEIDPDTKALAPMRNPANRKQVLDVVEVWGYVHKGQYRMRLIYFVTPAPATCTLVGQEILEHASL